MSADAACLLAARQTDPAGTCPSWLPCGIIALNSAGFQTAAGLAKTYYDNGCGGPHTLAAATFPTKNAQVLGNEFGVLRRPS